MPIQIHSPFSIPFGRLEPELGPIHFLGSPRREPPAQGGFLRVYIDPEENSAVTLDNVPAVFPAPAHACPTTRDPVNAVYSICETLRTRCELEGIHELLFLTLYFDRVAVMAGTEPQRKALLPLPKAHFCFPQKTVRVDFAFWTGRRFVAVFIDVARLQSGGAADEKLLRSYGFEVLRLRADQIETRGLQSFLLRLEEIANS